MASHSVRKVLTNAFVVDVEKSRVLLGMKKRGFGEGKFNGFGGKVEPGETIEQGARREIMEEAGVEVPDLQKVAEIIYKYDGMEKELEVHVFRGTTWLSDPRESEEMKPEWFSFSDVPFHSMWSDDIHWLPRLLTTHSRVKKEIISQTPEGQCDELLTCDNSMQVNMEVSSNPESEVKKAESSSVDQSELGLFQAYFYFADDMKTLKEFKVEQVSTFDSSTQ